MRIELTRREKMHFIVLCTLLPALLRQCAAYNSVDDRNKESRMSLLGYIGQVVSPPNGSPKVIAEPQLRFDEALACGQRIWMRGQLTDPALPRSPGATRPARWKRWRRNSAPTALPTIHVETRIGGHVLQTTVVLDRHGRFDTTLDIDLPIARRGWRPCSRRRRAPSVRVNAHRGRGRDPRWHRPAGLCPRRRHDRNRGWRHPGTNGCR